MKTSLYLLFACFFFATGLSAQDPTEWESMPLRSQKDYKKAEPSVKEAAAFLLGHKYNEDDVRITSANRLLLRWMTGTKDYSYSVQANISKYYTKDDPRLLMIYMAAMVQNGFENPALLKDSKACEIAAFKTIAAYCENPDTKVPHTAKLTKLIQAAHDDTLDKLLEL